MPERTSLTRARPRSALPHRCPPPAFCPLQTRLTPPPFPALPLPPPARCPPCRPRPTSPSLWTATDAGLPGAPAPRADGHRRGVANIRRVVSALAERGVSVVTLYAFSTENWRRPTNEVDSLMTILAEEIEPQTRALHEAGVRLIHLGDPRPLDAGLQDAIARAEQVTRHNAGVTLNIAFNYGGRHEILQAVRRILNDAIPPEQVDETLFGRYLYTKGGPDPDLIIRTGGEQRISNFLLWQGRLQRVLPHPCPLARPGRPRTGPRPARLRPTPPPLRRPGRIPGNPGVTGIPGIPDNSGSSGIPGIPDNSGNSGVPADSGIPGISVNAAALRPPGVSPPCCATGLSPPWWACLPSWPPSGSAPRC